MNYLYRHIRLDTNLPFYIGIGVVNEEGKTQERMYPRAYRKTKRSEFWEKTIAITDYEVEILMEDESREFICAKEIEFIELYGRRNLNKGSLVNLTDGGDGGALGIVRSASTLAQQSLNLSGDKHFNYNKVLSKEVKANISKSLEGFKDILPEDWGSHCRGGKNPSAREVEHKITKNRYSSLKEATQDLELSYDVEWVRLKKRPEKSLFRYLSTSHPHKMPTIHIETKVEYNSLAEACKENDDNYGYQIKLIKRNAKNAKYKYKH